MDTGNHLIWHMPCASSLTSIDLRIANSHTSKISSCCNSHACISTWWRHQMEIFSVSLALCAGNSSVTGEFSWQRPMTRSFDVFFYPRLNKRWVHNQDAGDFRRHRAHYDVSVMIMHRMCINIYALKRVYLIIDILAGMQTRAHCMITWTEIVPRKYSKISVHITVLLTQTQISNMATQIIFDQYVNKTLQLYHIFCFYAEFAENNVIFWFPRVYSQTSNDAKYITVTKGLLSWCSILTQWGRDKMAAISLTTFSNAFCWMKMCGFHLRFHWNVFLWFELAIFQHWFR